MLLSRAFWGMQTFFGGMQSERRQIASHPEDNMPRGNYFTMHKGIVKRQEECQRGQGGRMAGEAVLTATGTE